MVNFNSYVKLPEVNSTNTCEDAPNDLICCLRGRRLQTSSRIYVKMTPGLVGADGDRYTMYTEGGCPPSCDLVCKLPVPKTSDWDKT